MAILGSGLEPRDHGFHRRTGPAEITAAPLPLQEGPKFASMGRAEGVAEHLKKRKNPVGHPAEYHRPGSLTEACDLLRSLGPEALPLAGGTDLMVDIRRGTRRPRHLVSLLDLEELRGLTLQDGVLTIGALVTPDRLASSSEVRGARPELLDAVGVFGTPQVRRRATVGGNLCTAASCADLSPLLLALGARIVVAGPEGTRTTPLHQFFGDHRKTLLEPGEILTEILVPERRAGEGAAYEAFGLRATNFISVAAAAAFLRIEDGLCVEARLALGAVAPTPFLVPEAEDVLVDTEVDEDALDGAGRVAAKAAAPITDIRGSAEHRKELVRELSRKALRTARERAQ